MDSQMQQLRLAAINRARATDAEWYRAGKLARASIDFKSDDPYMSWYWPGPETETREAFWGIVRRARCVVVEFINDAIIGLVWCDGYPVVAYDTHLAQMILRRKWVLGSDSKQLRTDIEAQELARFEELQKTDFGHFTPWFLT